MIDRWARIVVELLSMLRCSQRLPVHHSSLSSKGYQSSTDYAGHLKKLLPDEKKYSICAAAISPCQHTKKMIDGDFQNRCIIHWKEDKMRF